MASGSAAYRGRFAPTPSGPLHLGSLVTAAASWLDARSQGGTWLLRIDDLDPPRQESGAADRIQQQLEAFGLHWDGPVIWQSQRHALYQQGVDALLARHQAFYCRLSRRELAAMGGVHPGVTRAVEAGEDVAIRLAVNDAPVCFDDAVAGRCCLNLAHHEGAFVIRRRDGLFAYQLACALDDADLGITHVLRGDDLLDSTFRQLHVLACLGRSAPRYGHLPVIRDARGEKLSKSTGAAAIDMAQPAAVLARALTCLGMKTEAAATPAAQLAMALEQWRSPFAGGASPPQGLT